MASALRAQDSLNSILASEDGDKTDFFLKVQMPDDSTSVVHLQSDMMMWEVMTVIASKKQITPSQHTAKIQFINGKSEMADDGRTLSSYVAVERLVLQKRSDAGESTNLAKMRQGRRSSIMVAAPKATTVRMSSQEFPKTETDGAVLAMRLATAKADAGVLARNKKTIKNVAMFLFNKKSSVDMGDSASALPGTGSGESSYQADSPRDGNSETGSLASGTGGDGGRNRFSITSTTSRGRNSYTYASTSRSSLASMDSDLDTLYDGRKQASSVGASFPISQNVRRSFSLMRSNTASAIAALAGDQSLSESSNSVDHKQSSDFDDGPHLRSQHDDNDNSPTDENGGGGALGLASSMMGSSTLSRTESFIAAQNREKIRKRTVSSPSTSGTAGYATLKRPVIRANRQRSGMDVLSPTDVSAADGSPLSAESSSTALVGADGTVSPSASVTSPAPAADDAKKGVLLKVTLPDNQSTTIMVQPEITMETLLLHICQKRLLDFEQYTLEVPKEGVTVEVDRPVGFYIQTCGISGVLVVKKEKVYSTMCVSENGQDVMILALINGKPQVMAATPAKLIERLSDEAEDNAFLDTLLLTYRHFFKPLEFFDQLVARFNSELPPDPTPEDVEYFDRMKLPTQKRVIAAFKWWVQYHYHDFGVDSSIKADLEDFVEQITSYNDGEFRTDAMELYEIIEKQGTAYQEMFNNYKGVERKGKTIEGMVQEISVENLSRQLCIHDFKLFHNIHPIEYLNQIWQSNTESSPSMIYFIDRFDKESYWCATEIVKEKDLKKRTALLQKFILTGKMCQELNNFFTMYAIIAGLNVTPVQRLKKTWAALSDKAKNTWAELEKIADPSRNMKNYRDKLAVATPPIVPFLPLYLKDLTFMNDGNESKMGEQRQMINFDKLRMMGNRVKDISGLGSVEYGFDPIPPIQNFLSKPPIEKSLAKLKEMSVECEKAA
ncbi:hypothetical protein HKX48_001505 [Thoreauomyces humboldtii]|nr:hypothetical protein HKX48_001505 [Thoreauomyces humboldtii]